MKELIIILNELGACEDAMEWLFSQTTLEEAWENCTRGDWLLWLVAALDVNERKLLLVKGLVARQVIHLMNDKRSIAAVRAALDYGKGRIGKDELEKAALTARKVIIDTDYYYDDISTNAAYAACAACTTASSAVFFNVVVNANIIKKIYSFDEIKMAIL